MKDGSTVKICCALSLGMFLILSGLVLPAQAARGAESSSSTVTTAPATVLQTADQTTGYSGALASNNIPVKSNIMSPSLPRKLSSSVSVPNAIPPIAKPFSEPVPNPTGNLTPPFPPRIVYPIPDFTIESLDNSELTILPGSVVASRVFIKNAGLLWYDKIPVALYDGNVSSGNLTVMQTAFFDRYSANVSFNLTGLGVGTHPITVVVDPNNEAIEQNENNNTATFVVRVTTTSSEPLSIIDLIKLLMAEVNSSAPRPFSNIVNHELIEAIKHIQNANKEYAKGETEDAVESVNDAMNSVYKATDLVKQFYKAGKITLTNATDIWNDAEIILKRIVDL
ncbi:MAG: hypothetical protein HZB92_03720, partial [Euryarchaeota archaeon]|nr:hypothetical protein [Euryarchaeota archaeon]